MKVSKPDIKYNLEDHLGSSMTLLDDNGSWVNWEEYYPFGESSLGSYAKKRYRFCSKERDEESGLYYYGARYYLPWLCRFASVDPLALKNNYLSPYCYADNNPILMNDPTGMDSEGGEKSSNLNRYNENNNQSNAKGVVIKNQETGKGEIYVMASFVVIKGDSNLHGFSQEKVNSIKEIQGILNNQTLKLEKDVYFDKENLKGFDVKFVFEVVEVSNLERAFELLKSESAFSIQNNEGLHIIPVERTLIRNYESSKFSELPNVPEIAKKHNTNLLNLAGVTSINKRYIAMQEGVIAQQPSGGTFQSNVLHEIFHSFGVDRDNYYLGIGRGNTMTPIENDIRELVISLVNSKNLIYGTSAPSK